MSNLKDLDHTQLLLKAMEMEEKIVQFEIEQAELKIKVRNLALYLQIQAI